MNRSVLAALWTALILGGCGPRVETSGATASERPATLRVAAASDLQAALPLLSERFEADSGIEVEPVIGASGLLAQQIRQGAPYDLFLSANVVFVRDLADAGAVRPDSVRPYARGSLVLAIGDGSGVGALDDLTKSGVKKIALANPDFAPYGRAARQALERAGLWETLGPKLVLAETVRQALQFVQSGNAEAGLIGRAIADVPGVRVVEIDPALYDPLVQALGVVAHSEHPEAAERFARFLVGEAGQEILARFGFRPPEETNRDRSQP